MSQEAAGRFEREGIGRGGKLAGLAAAVAICWLAPASVPAQAGEACADLAPADDGTEVVADLVISEIVPGSYIELFNASENRIRLSEIDHLLENPINFLGLSTHAGASAPAGGYVRIPWPETFLFADADGGEIVLWSDLSGQQSAMLDYVCWGDSLELRRSQAEGFGKWSGSCAAALEAGAIARLIATTGIDAGSYDTASSPDPCPLIFADGFENGDSDSWSSATG